MYENIALIAVAGFDGISVYTTTRANIEYLQRAIAGTGRQIEGICFLCRVEDLALPLALAAQYPVTHINLQPDIRPRRIDGCLPLLDALD